MRLPHYHEFKKTKGPTRPRTLKDAEWFQAIEASGIVVAAISALITTVIAYIGFSELAAERADRKNARIVRAWNLLDARGPGSVSAIETLVAEGVDLSYLDLSGLRLSGLDVSGLNARFLFTDFTSSQLINAKLAGANFGGATFRCAEITGVDFSNSNLIGADFTGAVAFPWNAPNFAEALLQNVRALAYPVVTGAEYSDGFEIKRSDGTDDFILKDITLTDATFEVLGAKDVVSTDLPTRCFVPEFQ